MPALCAWGQHAALAEVSESLQDGELLLAFLDGVCVLCAPERAVDVFRLVESALDRHAGIQVNLGKTKVWNAAGVQPPRVEELGDSAWVGGQPPAESGVVVLGTPVGDTAFIQRWLHDKLGEELTFLDRIPLVPDAQCAWLLLLLCAGPRAVHVLRNLPP